MSYLSREYQARSDGVINYPPQDIKKWMRNATRKASYHANRRYGENRPDGLAAVLDEDNHVYPHNSEEHVNSVVIGNRESAYAEARKHVGTNLGIALSNMVRAYDAWSQGQGKLEAFVDPYSSWPHRNHI